MDFQKKDIRILQQLDLNARQSVSEIARKIGLSKELTNYRLKRMEIKKILKGYYTLYNVYYLGYSLHKLFIRLAPTTKDERHYLLNYLSKIDSVGIVAETFGAFDLEIGIIAPSIKKFEEIYFEIISRFGSQIKSKYVTCISEMWQYNRKYLFSSSPDIKIYHYCQPEKIAKYDKRIVEVIRLLANQARISCRDIEDSIKLSRGNAAKIISKLLNEKVILGFRPIIHLEEMELTKYRSFVKLLVRESPEITWLYQYLGNNPNVMWVIKTIAPWDMEIETELKDSRELHEFVLNLRSKFKNLITEIDSIEIINEIKYEFSIC